MDGVVALLYISMGNFRRRDDCDDDIVVSVFSLDDCVRHEGVPRIILFFAVNLVGKYSTSTL